MKNKKVIFSVLILCLLSGICFYCFRKPVKNNITLYGNVDIRNVNLAFRIGGRIKEMIYDEGDVIKNGDIIAELDEQPIRNKFNQAVAKLDQAKANAQNANRYYNRNISLCRAGTISRQECDNITSKKEEADANVSYMQSVVDEALIALNDTKLVAPSDGIILTRIFENGAIVGAGVPVYTLSLNDKMWVRAYITGEDLGRVKIGDKVKVSIDSNDKVYEGQIGFISPQAEFTPKNIETTSLRGDLVYRIRIVILNPDDFLKQGMPVSIEISKNE